MRFISALATFVAAAALACVVAYWGWHALGPSVAHVGVPEPANPAASIVAANLFGRDAQTGAAPLASSNPVLGNDTRLLGIISEDDRHGYALFRGPAGARLVAQGQEIASGVVLVSIDTSAVTIRDGAGERRMSLRTEPSRDGTSTPRSPSTAPAPSLAAGRVAPNRTCAPPPGFSGTVVRLNTELMSGAGGDTMQWNRLLAPVEGGLVVREDNGFGAMLGLKTGDRIAQANGIALSVPDDVSTAIVRPLVGNQGVRLIGSRNGLTQEMWLANVACAG
jgi:hypothetical protein